MKRLEDWLLAFLQRRCEHPPNMVAADILEGCVPHIQVKYCRRCGSVKTDWSPHDPAHRFISLEHFWRRPDPHLWRGVLTIVTLCGMLAGCEAQVAVSSQPAEATPARFYVDGESKMGYRGSVWLIHDTQRPAECALVLQPWGGGAIAIMPWACE